MIYQKPVTDAPLDQGDIIVNCPVFEITHFDVSNPASPDLVCSTSQVVVLSQACDLANSKMVRATVALVMDAQSLIDAAIVKESDVRGPIRAGRVFGWYFLPGSRKLGLSESIVDLRQLHTVPIPVLESLCRNDARKARLMPLYREHLAKHFADTYSRIGLPMPYETE